MAPKKHTGFMMYVMEFRRKNPEGQRMTISQAVDRCGAIWKKMTDQQRGPYNVSARNAEILARAQKKKSVNPELEAAAKIDSMKRDIERMVREGRNHHDLENTIFVFASFNFFAKALNTKIYIPAEFAACEFSLQGGVNSLYSTLIDPGQLIFGQACDAMLHATSTHLLPLPPMALGESNMTKLYQSIQDYLRSRLDRSDKELKSLVVFTKTDDITMVKSCFHFIETGYKHEQNNRDDNDENQDEFYKAGSLKFLPIVVYDMQYLFLLLKREAMDIGGLTVEKPNLFITNSFFLRDYFEFQDGIACRFHEDEDRSKYCTQSQVKRWAYTFCDYMCADMAIAMKPGKHMPPSLKSTTTVTEFKSDASIDSYFSLTTVSTLTLQAEDREKPSPSPTISAASSLTSINTLSTLKSSDNGRDSKKLRHFSVCNLNNLNNTLSDHHVMRTEREKIKHEMNQSMDDITDDEFKIRINDTNWTLSEPED